MKMKIFAILVALLFIGTATISVTATNEAKPIPKRPRRFSGEWGITKYCDGNYIGDVTRGRTKGIIMFKKQGSCPPKLIVKGVFCLDDDKPEGCMFNLLLIKDRTPCGKMLHGIFRGTMRCQWNCENPDECDYGYDDCGCCDDFLCCNHARGPFTGDWFVYHGWLMIQGTYYGHKIWFKAYIGSWFYPGIECYIPTH